MGRRKKSVSCADDSQGADDVGTGSNCQPKSRGFADLSAEALRELGSKGGTKALENGTLHQFSCDDQRRGGQAGGKAVSSNRAHMSELGKMGAAALALRRAREAGTIQE
ncbi:MAG: hypothetical protein KBC15_03760 [Candidatus Levybacteria bacterium]|nr:hypothetical protein [Candidatus Levybacteria bacterium]